MPVLERELAGDDVGGRVVADFQRAEAAVAARRAPPRRLSGRVAINHPTINDLVALDGRLTERGRQNRAFQHLLITSTQRAGAHGLFGRRA